LSGASGKFVAVGHSSSLNHGRAGRVTGCR
jgi:hypothetical protein